MKTMVFKLIAGQHMDEQGVLHHAPAQITSRYRLDKMFHGKFEVIGKGPDNTPPSTKLPVPPPVPEAQKPVTPATEVITAPAGQVPAQAPKPAAQLKLKHNGGNRWHVINEVTGEQITKKALPRTEAMKMIQLSAPAV